MSLDLGAHEHGCLLLADITGYTDYLAGTELMHAQDVLADLLETLVASVEPTFKLSKLEGDAAFAHADAKSLNPSMVMDTVESAYFAFRKRLRDVIHSTTCECNACVLIPSLDLKFFIHNGEYVVRHIAGSEELTGPDVILVHRLAKGSSGEVIGKPAYVVYTSKALEHMAMDPTILGFVSHTETFDDIGEVPVFIQDLDTRWAFEQERHREYVTSEDAVYEVSFETPAPPSLVWTYLTDPSRRVAWQKNVTGFETMTEGRRGTGTINHCAHGPDIIVEHIADWRPFSYITVRYDINEDLQQWAWTVQLDPVDDGTKVTTRISDPGPIWETARDEAITDFEADLETLKEMLKGEMATTADVS